MSVNIKTVAKLAGVSVSTVSKIINNYSEISEETRQKVLDIMAETGYIPSNSAKTLATKKSNLIGVIFAGKLNIDFTHPFFVEVLNAFKKQMGILGYDLLFFSNEKFHPVGEDYLARCRHFQVDGCIVISGQELESTIQELDQSPIPCIGVDLRMTGKNSGYIMSDNEKISTKVIEHFYLQGYRDIGFIGSTTHSEISSLREQGLIKSLQDWGLPVNPDWFVHGEDFYEESGYRAMKQMMKNGPLPRAVFAGSDLLAIGAIRALHESDIRVPEDVAIIGCDNIDAAKYTTPPLTTVKQDKEKIGKLAALMLYDLISNQMNMSSVFVEPELVIRKSCGAK
ncbi:LacI family DNA-binding transcriptional regulator [Paenibacillus turpanensis]|uniref:LacI family DNA-binding transcriptional regulator n=1 Tax=Paenibacillus turpanensis TaxID=2689078 RepID=UPI00140A4703|nr:LacI family DNA-binding transcriptional regulator [Paenibacillus turpanensis]